jgi:hypothetical protein
VVYKTPLDWRWIERLPTISILVISFFHALTDCRFLQLQLSKRLSPPIGVALLHILWSVASLWWSTEVLAWFLLLPKSYANEWWKSECAILDLQRFGRHLGHCFMLFFAFCGLNCILC